MSFGLVVTCREFVGTCWEFVRSCRELLGVVGSCRELSGLVGNVDFMESHFEGIAIVVDKISAEFPIPEILRSVPGINSCNGVPRRKCNLRCKLYIRGITVDQLVQASHFLATMVRHFVLLAIEWQTNQRMSLLCKSHQSHVITLNMIDHEYFGETDSQEL